MDIELWGGLFEGPSTLLAWQLHAIPREFIWADYFNYQTGNTPLQDLHHGSSFDSFEQAMICPEIIPRQQLEESLNPTEALRLSKLA